MHYHASDNTIPEFFIKQFDFCVFFPYVKERFPVQYACCKVPMAAPLIPISGANLPENQRI